MQRYLLDFRYVNLAIALAWREISVKVRRRFPETRQLVQCGLMTDRERQLYDSYEISVKWYAPITWVVHIINAYTEQVPIPAPLLSLFYQVLVKPN